MINKPHRFVLAIAALTLFSCGGSPKESSSTTPYIPGPSTSSSETTLPSQESSSTHEHTFSSTWSYDETYHYHQSTCGHDVISDKEEHVFDSILTPTTHEEKGYIEYFCTICGYSYSETLPTETFDITYDLDGGVNSKDNPATYTDADETFYLAEPTRDEAVFLGWTSAEITIPTKKVAIEKGTLGDLSFKANWFINASIKNNANVDEPDPDTETYIRYCLLQIDPTTNIFVLAYFTIYESGFVKCTADCGQAILDSNGVYRLKFSDSELPDQFVYKNGISYVFCDVNGVPIDEAGNEDVPVVVENLVPAYLRDDAYGYQSLNTHENAEAMQTLYNELAEAAERIAKSQVDLTDETLFIADLAGYGLDFESFSHLFKLFLLDNPEFYFISQSFYGNDDIAYLFVDEEYFSAEYRAKIDADIEMMIKDCAKVITAGSSDLDKYLAIHDYVVSLIDYAYQEDGVTPEDALWAHSLVGGVEMGKGVCECYSETFDVLCRHYGLKDIQVTGTVRDNQERHVWNLIEVDGQYYSVDATWDDKADGDISHGFFGCSYADTRSYKETDSPDKKGVEYLYAIPKMSTASFQLLYLNYFDTRVGLFKNIDDAFALMDDENGDYSIEFFAAEVTSGPLLFTSAAVIYEPETLEWPKVHNIDIIGFNIELGNDFYTQSRLWLKDGTHFNSDVSFSNLYVNAGEQTEVDGWIVTDAGKLNFDNHVFTLKGRTCHIMVTIDSPLGELRMEGSENHFIAGRYCKLGTMTLARGALIFYPNLEVASLHFAGGNISFYGGTQNLWCDVNIGRIEIDSARQVTMEIRANDGGSYHVNVGDIINNVGESVRFRLILSTDANDFLPDLRIVGANFPDDLIIALMINGTTTIVTTDLAGNIIDMITTYATLSEGTVVFYGPNIPVDQLEFGSTMPNIYVEKDDEGSWRIAYDQGE